MLNNRQFNRLLNEETLNEGTSDLYTYNSEDDQLAYSGEIKTSFDEEDELSQALSQAMNAYPEDDIDTSNFGVNEWSRYLNANIEKIGPKMYQVTGHVGPAVLVTVLAWGENAMGRLELVANSMRSDD